MQTEKKKRALPEHRQGIIQLFYPTLCNRLSALTIKLQLHSDTEDTDISDAEKKSIYYLEQYWNLF